MSAPAFVRFIVPGDPRPKGRPRFGNGFVHTPRETQRAEHTVKVIARNAGARPMQGAVAVDLKFYRATKRRCDVDNLAKLVLDALNGIAWRDDDQIASLTATKAHDPENPRTEVMVEAHPPPETSPLDTPASSLGGEDA